MGLKWLLSNMGYALVDFCEVAKFEPLPDGNRWQYLDQLDRSLFGMEVRSDGPVCKGYT